MAGPKFPTSSGSNAKQPLDESALAALKEHSLDRNEKPADPQKRDQVQNKETTDNKQIENGPEGKSQDLARKNQQQQQASGKKPQDKTDYQVKDNRGSETAELPQQLGHKINVNQQVATSRQNLGDKASAGQQGQNTASEAEGKNTSRQQSQFSTKQPSSKVYKQLLAQPSFQGGLKGTPLHQKLLKRAVEQNIQKQIMYADPQESLEKGDILQLFSMRHKSKNKKDLKQIIKHEIARAKNKLKQTRVNSLKHQTGSKHQKETHKMMQKKLSSDRIGQQLQKHLQAASKESPFERVLQKVLAGKQSVPNLPEGVRAKFLQKTTAEWRQFFKNVLGTNSQLVKSNADVNQLIEALFRGIYTGEEGGEYLILDLALSEDGEAVEYKYSQLLLEDGELAKLFKKMHPGELLAGDLLKQLGEELQFLKLMTAIQLAVMTEEEKKANLNKMRQAMRGSVRDDLENALIKKRNGDQKKRESQKEPFVYAGNQFDNKEERKGKQTFFLYLAYTIAIAALSIGMYFLIKNL